MNWMNWMTLHTATGRSGDIDHMDIGCGEVDYIYSILIQSDFPSGGI